MELNYYDVIKKSVITPKSELLFKKHGQYVFFVHKDANKLTVRKALEKAWKVKVDKVRVINVKGKLKEFGKRPFRSLDVKKVIVSLKKGYKIDLPTQFETMGITEKDSKSKTREQKG